MRRDLAGTLVVSVEQAVAAPLASAKLADAGARVIKVERPEGDFARAYDRDVRGESAYFVWLNRGKESVSLDLRDAADRALLERMIAAADVFIQNLKPGALARFGLGSERLRARHPRLITCDITGFGEGGPLSDLKAYDLIVQAEAGLCSITGTDGPARAGISVCDIAAGTSAHAAILEAILGRAGSGQGRRIHVSLFDSLAEWMNVPILQYVHGGHVVPRSGVSHPTIAPYGAFACADGAVVVLSVQNDREWRRFCADVLARSALASDPRLRTNADRSRRRAEVDALVSDTLGGLSFEAAAARLHRAGIAHGRLNDVAAAVRHPHLRFQQVPTVVGEVQVVAAAAIHDVPERPGGAVPSLGAHGARLRREFDPR